MRDQEAIKTKKTEDRDRKKKKFILIKKAAEKTERGRKSKIKKRIEIGKLKYNKQYKFIKRQK